VLSMCAHHFLAWWAWETGAWAGSTATPIMSITIRAALHVGLLTIAGATSWLRCGHKGWLALLALGAAAWALAWAT